MTFATRYNLATLVLRLSLGTMFLAHGLLKVLVLTLPGTAQFFASVGFGCTRMQTVDGSTPRFSLLSPLPLRCWEADVMSSGFRRPRPAPR